MGQSRTQEILQSILDGNPYGKPPLSRNEALLIEIGQLIEQGFSPEQIEAAVNKYLEEHPVSAGMEYYILTFDGTAFKHDGVVLTFAEIRSKCLDTKHFVYATYENNLYIPQNISTSYVFFDSSYIRSDQAQMHRISINNSEHVQKYDYVLAKQTEVDAIKDEMSTLQNDGETPVEAGKVWTTTADGAGWADGGAGGSTAGYGLAPIGKLVADFTLEEDVKSFVIDRDINGNSFSLKKAYVTLMWIGNNNASSSYADIQFGFNKDNFFKGKFISHGTYYRSLTMKAESWNNKLLGQLFFASSAQDNLFLMQSNRVQEYQGIFDANKAFGVSIVNGEEMTSFKATMQTTDVLIKAGSRVVIFGE